jgi:hypothetical protein
MKRTLFLNSSIAALLFSAAPCAFADGGIGNEVQDPQLRSCDSDVNGDAWVDFGDLLQVISDWGHCPQIGINWAEPESCASDTDGDGQVGWLDMLDVLANQGMSCNLILAAQSDDLGNRVRGQAGFGDGGAIQTSVDPSGRDIGDGRDPSGGGLSGGDFGNGVPGSQGFDNNGGPIASAAGGDFGNGVPSSQGFDNNGGPIESAAGRDLGDRVPQRQGTSHFTGKRD